MEVLIVFRDDSSKIPKIICRKKEKGHFWTKFGHFQAPSASLVFQFNLYLLLVLIKSIFAKFQSSRVEAGKFETQVPGAQVPGIRCAGFRYQVHRFRVSGAQASGTRCQVSGVQVSGFRSRFQVPTLKSQ